MSANQGRGRGASQFYERSMPDYLQVSDHGGRGRGSSSTQLRDFGPRGGRGHDYSQVSDRGGRGRESSSTQLRDFGPRGGRGHGVIGQYQQRETSPMRGPQGGRGHGAIGQHQPRELSPMSGLRGGRGHDATGQASSVHPTSVERGQLPPMSRYGAYAAFTRQRDQLDKVTHRLEEHKKDETVGQVQEVSSEPLQRDEHQHDPGFGFHEGGSSCASCQFRAECAVLIRSIGALLMGFGNASEAGGAHDNGET